LYNGFVHWDDYDLIVENPYIRRLGWDQVRWMFSTFYMGPYQPLPWLTLAIDRHLWGPGAFGIHLTNLLWHSASAVSFYALGRKLLGLAIAVPGRDPLLLSVSAAIAAAMFAMHPLRVESVAWASARRDVLSAFFTIWTVWVYVRAAESVASRTSRAWRLAAVWLFLTSLLCKATGICLPLVLTVLDFYPLGRLNWSLHGVLGPKARSVWFEKIPFWLLACAGGAAALYGQSSQDAMASVSEYGLIDRLALASFGVAFYLRKTLFPVGLSPLYEIPPDLVPWQFRFVASGGVGLAVTAICLRLARRVPALPAVWLSYLFLLAPVSGLTQTGYQLAADRYSYLPCGGFALLAGGCALWGAAFFPNRRQQQVFACGLCATVVVLLGLLTANQTRVWRNTEVLWRHALRVNPQASVVPVFVARSLVEQQRYEEAAPLLLRAIRLRPNSFDAHNILAVVLRRTGNPYEAMRHYQEAENLYTKSGDVQYNIALLLSEENLLGQLGFESQEQQWQEALNRFHRALALRPDHLKALNDLGILQTKMGRLDEATRYYSAVLRIAPDDIRAQYNLANALVDMGRFDAAEARYRQVLAESSGHVEARVNLAELLQRRGSFGDAVKLLRDGLNGVRGHRVLTNNLAWLLAAAPDERCRDGMQAIQLARQLRDESPRPDPRTLDLLAAAQAEQGQFLEAETTAANALELARQLRLPKLAEAIEQRLELYRLGRPFRLEAE
jgi:tetratricopeptide (TPR) repeat protein